MKHLVRFQLEDGESIVVAVDEPESGTTHRAASPHDMVVNAQENFQQALRPVRAATEAAITQLRSLAHKPDEIEMEFGFSLTGTVGAVIASAAPAANYKVTVRWKAKDE